MGVDTVPSRSLGLIRRTGIKLVNQALRQDMTLRAADDAALQPGSKANAATAHSRSHVEIPIWIEMQRLPIHPTGCSEQRWATRFNAGVGHVHCCCSTTKILRGLSARQAAAASDFPRDLAAADHGAERLAQALLDDWTPRH